ncbi:uncharacterized protein KD926_004650 [Aspergillus affinis]|uniref:uncharacterized protein n=1 Tax=Aspergillus affinis TaxID=1070780 RepID=UPI0022FDFAB0|nr:uncharacterized protein KD926_004650 [Aspergillus affinis]KAI9035085.1 hypothetical protein KD926_004650 [Aspergillus affinis]
MRNHSVKEERANDSTGQKQDPVERRRLQNRLSQRNHRRKIRDRIAKLQERVIASELRAAASLNGWGYPNPGPSSVEPVAPYEVDSKTLSPSSENAAHFDPYYPAAPGVCPTCSSSMGAIPVICSQPLTPPSVYETPKESESANSSPPSMTNSFYEAGVNFFGPDMSSSALSNYSVAELNVPFPSESWGQTQYPSSALYYVATESSLPQIIQTLGSGASRTKALVLIPQAQATGMAMTSPVSQAPTSRESATPISPLSLQGCGCQCQNHDAVVGLPSSGFCPVHSTQNMENCARGMNSYNLQSNGILQKEYPKCDLHPNPRDVDISSRPNYKVLRRATFQSSKPKIYFAFYKYRMLTADHIPHTPPDYLTPPTMASPDYSHHFSIHNLPYGAASSPTHRTQCATRLHNNVIFLGDLQRHGFFSAIPDLPARVFDEVTLNRYAALPKRIHHHVREILQSALASKDIDGLPESCRENVETVKMHLPVDIPNFTDFSCSLNHVQNAGRAILNNPTPPPGFFHFPIGYTGRANSIVVSGTQIVRPRGHIRGQTKSTPTSSNGESKGEGETPKQEVIYAPSRALDYELELGFVVGAPVDVHQGLEAKDAEEYLFGVVVVNDWSARDIQSLEMVPLGPLNGKSFNTSISPWIVTLEALAPFRAVGPAPRAELPLHLQDPGAFGYDISLRVELEHSDSSAVEFASTSTSTNGSHEKGRLATTHLSTSNAKDLFWSPRQMLAHMASSGCGVRTGELLGTGTVSGTQEGEYGCLLEITGGGKTAVRLNSSDGSGGGEERVFLMDGDVVRMVGLAGEGVGFGECMGEIVSSL